MSKMSIFGVLLAVVLWLYPLNVARAACADPAAEAGGVYYNTSAESLQYCNGTNWIGSWVKSAGALAIATLGNNGTCGIRNENFSVCWGSDSSGQLGNGAITGTQLSMSLVDIAGSIPDTWKTLTGHSTIACGIASDDTGWCWGSDTSGQLGNGAVAGNQVSPSAIDITGAIPDTWKVLSAQNNLTCGIGGDDTAWCWGADTNGELGNGATAGTQISPSAVDVAGSIPDTWKSISTGSSYACAISIADTIWCWGLATSGRLGNDDDTGTYPSPDPVDTSGAIPDTWKVVSTGDAHTCAIGMADTLWCWGSDNQGQIGNGATTGNQTSPVAVDIAGSIPDTWKTVSAGAFFSCGIASDDTLWCWGSDINGQLGDGGSAVSQASPSPVDITGNIPDTWKAVDTGSNHTCAVASDNTFWCWGISTNGVLGEGFIVVLNNFSPVAVREMCTNPAAITGSLYYNTTHHVLQFCSRAGWVAMGPYGNGGAGCTNPTGSAGGIYYNSGINTLQYCEGDSWVSVLR